MFSLCIIYFGEVKSMSDNYMLIVPSVDSELIDELLYSVEIDI